MAENGLSIQDSVGAALRFSREQARFIFTIAATGAAAAALISVLALTIPGFALLSGLFGGAVQAFVYAAFCAAALGAGDVRARLAGDGMRVWAAMAVVGFFLFIVMFVVSIPVMIVMVSGPLAPFLEEMQGAGNDQAAVMDVMTRFAEANPGALLLAFLFYAVIWFYLTSRLYLAAPASVERGRILTFDTWNWTNGSALRIIGARLMVLAPAYVLATALAYLVGRLLGIDAINPDIAAIQANVAGYAVYAFVSGFITLGLYSALEAGLSSALYRRLAPPPASPQG